jgi:hypothetical protein
VTFYAYTYRIARWYGNRQRHLFGILAEDLREAGLLTIVFLIVDYMVDPSRKTDGVVFKASLKGGIVSLLAGYLIEMLRKL